MKFAKDSFVVIEYDVRLDDGSFIIGETEPVSMNFVVGYGQLLPGLEKRLLGLSSGAMMVNVLRDDTTPGHVTTKKNVLMQQVYRGTGEKG